MSRLISLVCFCALIVYSNVEAARILAVFPTPSISHQVVFRPLTHELARRGHEVVVITTDPAFPKGQAPANLTEIDVHDISYELWRKMLENNKNGNVNSISEQMQLFLDAALKIFEKQVSDPEVQDVIKKQNSTFDLLLVEACARYALAFSHAVKVPVIAVSSFGAMLDNYDVIGAPTNPLLYHHALSTRVYNLSLWEKFSQYYDNYYSVMNIHKKSEARENAIVQKMFGDDAPELSELQNNIGMLFLNIHPLWEGNRPVPPGVIHIGGMHQKQEKELPQDLKQYLDSSVHGVIYLSFGTNVDTSVLPLDKIQAIIKVFSQLPYDILWKWNQDELPGRSKNIKISKWFPQADLLKNTVTKRSFPVETALKFTALPRCFVKNNLGHPKVKLFITQGGLQSTDETITAGVPVIGIPMLGDQFYNAEKYEHHKIGKKLYLDDLNEEILKDAIKTVIEDKSYRENIVRLRTLMYDQPMSSMERAVWWTEHVLRHGTRHLRAPAANMGAFEYYELHLVLTVLAIATAVILLGSFILYKIVRLVLVSSGVKIKKL